VQQFESPCASFDETLCRWREHFEAALNHPPGTQSDELDTEADNVTVDPDTPVDASSLDEVVSAIRKLRNGRAAGPDGIPPELLKCAIGPVSTALHAIFTKVWRTGHIPADWKDGILTALYKGERLENGVWQLQAHHPAVCTGKGLRTSSSSSFNF